MTKKITEYNTKYSNTKKFIINNNLVAKIQFFFYIMPLSKLNMHIQRNFL